MIPIKLKKDCINALYHQLLDITPRQQEETKKEHIKKIQEINKWCKENIKIDAHSFTFPEIIQADYKTLSAICKNM